jgi:hypothetical protein
MRRCVANAATGDARSTHTNRGVSDDSWNSYIGEPRDTLRQV